MDRRLIVDRCGRFVGALPNDPRAARVRQWHGFARAAACLDQHDIIDHRRVSTGFTEQSEHQRYCGVRHLFEHLEPTELDECLVERLSTGRRHRLTQRVYQHVEVIGRDGVVHHSFPRSSSRRAMMLRCISAVPP